MSIQLKKRGKGRPVVIRRLLAASLWCAQGRHRRSFCAGVRLWRKQEPWWEPSGLASQGNLSIWGWQTDIKNKGAVAPPQTAIVNCLLICCEADSSWQSKNRIASLLFTTTCLYLLMFSCRCEVIMLHRSTLSTFSFPTSFSSAVWLLRRQQIWSMTLKIFFTLYVSWPVFASWCVSPWKGDYLYMQWVQLCLTIMLLYNHEACEKLTPSIHLVLQVFAHCLPTVVPLQ